MAYGNNYSNCCLKKTSSRASDGTTYPNPLDYSARDHNPKTHYTSFGNSSAVEAWLRELRLGERREIPQPQQGK